MTHRWASRWVSQCTKFWLPLLLVASCANSVGERQEPREGSDSGSHSAAEEEVFTGEHLAHIDFSATQTIDFWEVQPGNVIMLQNWDTSAGEESFDLSPILVRAHGLLGGVYQLLVKDENAVVPPALVAADERRRKQPIHDAASGAPAVVMPAVPAKGLTHGALAKGSVVKAPNEPSPTATELLASENGGALQVKKLTPDEAVGGLSFPKTGPFFCQPPHTEGGYCPGWGIGGVLGDSYYGFVNGSPTDAIFYDSMGRNPQDGDLKDPALMDYYELYQVINNEWARIFRNKVYRQHAIRVTYVGAPIALWGQISGNLVQYGDGYRLPFTNVTRSPYEMSWVDCDFCNDVQGMTHVNYFSNAGWFLSRTQFGLDKESKYGVIGWVKFTRTLGSPEYWPYQDTSDPGYQMPQAWLDKGFRHYGDLSVDQPHGRLFVSINDEHNKKGGIGVLGITGNLYGPPGLRDLGTVILNPDDSASWVAYDATAGWFYTPRGSSGIHVNSLSFSTPGAPAATFVQDVDFVNTASLSEAIDKIGGAKVSTHGKLWAWAATSFRKYELLGIDPYSGMIQVRFSVQTNPDEFCSWISCGDDREEAEGIDITIPPIRMPDVTMDGNIHVQLLGNEISDDKVKIVNFKADDLSRL
jgi:hypothetical protein